MKYEKDECSITELGLLQRVNEAGVGRPRTFFKYARFSWKDDDSDKIIFNVHVLKRTICRCLDCLKYSSVTKSKLLLFSLLSSLESHS